MELLVQLLPMIVIFAAMYYFMIRPQQKQAKEKQNMIKAMKPGDEVLTIGGLYGLVSEVDQAAGKVVIDCEGIYLTFALSAIREVVSSNGPAAYAPEDTSVTSDQTEEVTQGQPAFDSED